MNFYMPGDRPTHLPQQEKKLTMNNILFTATLTYNKRSTKFDSLYVIAAPDEEAAKALIDDLEGWNITSDVDCGYVLEMKEIGITDSDISIIEELTT